MLGVRFSAGATSLHMAVLVQLVSGVARTLSAVTVSDASHMIIVGVGHPLPEFARLTTTTSVSWCSLLSSTVSDATLA